MNGELALAGLTARSAIESDELDAEAAFIATGWSRLDAAIGGGFLIPSLNVLGAAPKAGKSTWAQIIAFRHAESEGVAYVLDLENGRRRYFRRLVCRLAERKFGERRSSPEATERWNA